MRSTIFTSLAVALLLAGAAGAQDGPRHGCYARDYSQAHLAQNPDQIVDRIVIEIGPAWYDPPEGQDRPTWMRLAVWTADQGHVHATGHENLRLDQSLVCDRDETGVYCAVECDGGWMRFDRDDGEILQLRTDRLSVGDRDMCGGVIDLAEKPHQAVSYRLDRVADQVCLDVFDRIGN